MLRGEWDSLLTDADARWLLDAISSSSFKLDVKFRRATHLMHLEENRHQLYLEAQRFLQDEGR